MEILELKNTIIEIRNLVDGINSRKEEISPACWEPGFQAWAQRTCPELSA